MMSLVRNLIAILAVAAACGGSPKHAGTSGDKPGRVVVSETTIEILDPIAFVGDTAELAPTSNPMLDATATTLNGAPDIKVVEIVVHGADKALAEQRAKTVLDQLVARKVAAARLRSSAGDEGAVRVAFVILERGD